MLAVFALNVEGIEGAIYQMLNHGLSTGALFLVVGILYERSHTRLIKDFGGVSSQMPVFSAFFLLAVLSSVGLPGLNGFVGEILCLFGIFAVEPDAAPSSPSRPSSWPPPTSSGCSSGSCTARSPTRRSGPSRT